MSENDKKIPLPVRDFHMKCGIWEILKLLGVISLLGEMLILSTSLGQPKFQQFLNFLCIFMCPSDKLSRTI